MTSKIFPQRLKYLRKSAGLTQAELGEKVGVKQNAFTHWENGNISICLAGKRKFVKGYRFIYENPELV